MVGRIFSQTLLHSTRAKAFHLDTIVATVQSKKNQAGPDASQQSDEQVGRIPSTNTTSFTSFSSSERVLIQLVLLTVLGVPHVFITEKLSRKLLYIHACLAMRLTPVNIDILELAENALRWLQDTVHVNLKLELDFCATIKNPSSEMSQTEWPPPRKRQVSFNNDEYDIFEACDICGESLGWTADLNARCANGHVFGEFIIHCRHPCDQRLFGTVLTSKLQSVVL